MVTGSISATDFLNAQKLHRAKVVRWCYVSSSIVLAVGVVLHLVNDRSSLGFILACAGVGGIVGELVMSHAYLPRKIRRIHRQQKDLAAPFTYQWDEHVLEAQGVSGQSKRPWENYAKFKEDENLFLLYHCDNLFEMFPKHWFRDQAQLNEFRGLAKRVNET